jgi:predicted tellurium resistance membrane protein TerC
MSAVHCPILSAGCWSLYKLTSALASYQYRVLYWGILGALIMRGAFIGIGALLLQHFHWIIFSLADFSSSRESRCC